MTTKCSECGRFIERSLWCLKLCYVCYTDMLRDPETMFDPRVGAMWVWIKITKVGI
jgi:hypothetical protein